MYELILTKGVNAQGLVVSQIDVDTWKIISGTPCDNWGYLLSGAILFTEAAERHARLPRSRLDNILAGVDRVATAVIQTDGIPWEGSHHDGYADSVESAIYIAARRPVLRRQLLDWADDQIAYMFQCQRPDGFVSDDYLDGNFIRTSMLEADALAAGFRLSPWVRGAGVGFAASSQPNTEPAIVIMGGPIGYRGRLIPDRDRHRAVLHLPWDWPRLNMWPEWAGIKSDIPSEGISIEVAPNQTKILRLTDLGASLWRLP